jgi:threonine dehydratase
VQVSGVATVVKGLDHRIQVIAAEPAEADDAYRSKMVHAHELGCANN